MSIPKTVNGKLEQIYSALNTVNFPVLVQVRNFNDKMGLNDDDVHPEIVNFFVEHANELATKTFPDFPIRKEVIDKSEIAFVDTEPSVPVQPVQPAPINQEGGVEFPLSFLKLLEMAKNGQVRIVKQINPTDNSFDFNAQALLENALQHIKVKEVSPAPQEPVKTPAPQEPVKTPAPKPLYEFDDDLIHDLSMRNVLKINKEGKLVHLVDDKEVEVGVGNESNCFHTTIPQDKCRRAIVDIILNQDADAYKKNVADLADSDFANASQKEISQMHPKLAEKILIRYGFKKLKVPEGNSTVEKMESVYNWLDRLSNETGVSNFEDIKRSTKLLLFLDMLVHFLNFNSVSLNQPEVFDETGLRDRTYLKYAKNLKHLPNIPLNKVEEPRNTLVKMVETQRNNELLRKSIYANPFPFPIVKIAKMHGGGNTGSSTLRVIIKGLIDDLQRRGKTLHDNDHKKIQESLTTLEHLDESLKIVAQQLTEYKEWISIASKKDETVSLGQISGNIDKYRECVAQYSRLENGLLDVAKKLSEL